jgi:KUP system potassium uptake protein
MSQVLPYESLPQYAAHSSINSRRFSMSLLNAKSGERAGVIIIGILGAALLYGDGAITPAISVLSAIEGIKAPVPAIAPYVLPLAVVVLIGVFALQPQGSGRIGKLYGPLWRFGSQP